MGSKCPGCHGVLSAEEVKKIWAQYCGSLKSMTRATASVTNGKKGGRPFKLQPSDQSDKDDLLAYVHICMQKLGKPDYEYYEFYGLHYEKKLRRCLGHMRAKNRRTKHRAGAQASSIMCALPGRGSCLPKFSDSMLRISPWVIQLNVSQLRRASAVGGELATRRNHERKQAETRFRV